MIKRKTINSDGIFSARTIQNYADTAVRNCKLATAFSVHYMQDGCLPSGWSRKDFIDKILDKMYDKLSTKPKSKKIINGEEREELLTQQRPPLWVFNGFMAFILYGPLAATVELKSNLMSGSKYSFIYLFVCLFVQLSNRINIVCILNR
jgi:hypothetical protein